MTTTASHPKHVQVREQLRALARERPPGAAMESERELMQRFDVSRATVRLAIQALVDDGLLTKEPARGTFVAERRVESRLHLASFTQDMLRRGHVPATRVLSMTTCPATEVPVEFFTDDALWRIERLRLADGEPIAVETTYLSTSALPVLSAEELAVSLYSSLRGHGLTPDAAEQSVTAVAADERSANLLRCPVGAPLLLFDRYTRAGEVPVERSLSWYLGERYSFHVDLDAGMPTD